MNNKEFDFLTKVFQADLDGRPFYQSKAKLADELVEKGWLEKHTINMRGVTARGYVFTLMGHMNYCEVCASRLEAGDEKDL